MKKVVIIEDEAIAAQRLSKMLSEENPDLRVVQVLQTVEDTVDWFQTNPTPDLVFMDIHLADGLAFRIFDKITIECPIIFTTAYDQYALQAFQVNSIDYLLKPISKEALERAVAKYHNLGRGLEQQQLEALLKHLGAKPKFKSCFLLPERDKLVPLPTSDIAYAYIDTKTVKLVTFDDKTFYMNQTLDDILAQLDPQMFFRANRQFLISRNAVKDVSVWFGNKLAINLTVETPEKVIVSKARVAEFKAWFVS